MVYVLLITVKAPVYCVELGVGVDPSAVYRIVAPDVEQDSVTCVELANVPPLGEILGVETFDVGLIVKLADAILLSV